ncbi:hypothetical protein N7519_008525 [Penicillium mononematosum]|uniref:uncharacterized protein n=1 Tax=Penicillium mononematosum TaxID=268346 RepID=UPI002548BDCB|nr:uncharacterized protein N7519_008525 [Penicillium mononematosum]KAJ6178064.1 hypothetical protein N7519_008525 [Penicillium mononematosum]
MSRPLLLKLRSSQMFIVATVSLSLFTHMFLYGMIVPVMPVALIIRTNIPPQDREFWNSVLFISEAGASVVSAPVFGYLLDRSNTRQGLYIFGLFMLLVSMGLLTAAFSITVYVAARVLQGSASAMVSVAGFSIVTDTVTKAHLGYMLGYIDVGLTLGFASGPLIGGIVYHAGGYYAVCGIAFGLIAIDLVLRLAVIEKKTAAFWLTLEVEASSAPVFPNLASQYGAIEPRGEDEDEIEKKGLFLFGKLLQQPRILICTWTFVLQSIYNAVLDTVIPIFVMDRFHWSTSGAGMVFLPIFVTVLVQPLSGYLSDRVGTRAVATTGFLLLAPTLICLRFVEHNTMGHKVALCGLLALFGLFNNGTSPCLMVEMHKVVDELEVTNPEVFKRSGAIAQTFSLQQMAQFTGMTVGPMIGGLTDHRYGWKTMTLCLGLLSAITAIPTLWMSGREATGELPKNDQENEPLLAE